MTDIQTAIQTAIQTLLDVNAKVVSCSSVGGGCISAAFKVTVVRRQDCALFVKCNEGTFLRNFQCEQEALAELGAVGAIEVPKPLASGLVGNKAWFVASWIDQSPITQDFFETFGRQLARLHRSSNGPEIGWPRDNYLGAAHQPNASCDSWSDFVSEHRIGYQLRWAITQGYDDRGLREGCESIMQNMSDLLAGRDDNASLLHGDLWSGNYLCGSNGEPVIIDPAVYRGCREAEFGMLKLFGGCPVTFYQAYQQENPMPDGWERRVRIYVLYHLLNHLNLFGSGYLNQCRTLASEILRDA